ncbi:MAG: glycerol-3-phosphate acyltransferase [Deltaproteobacteria bacterium]|nr:glycerol-3-phosphate acyltransferase [Deltaproteobacteria bacterium]
MIPALGALLVAVGYLLGSVPFGVVVGKVLGGVDPRTVGSGNIGASNVTRSAGKKAGALTLLLDAAKAALPMLAARALLGALGAGPGAAEAWSVGVGLAAFAGHLWPVWLRFQGGKGVATALGVFLVLAPMAALLAFGAFAVGYGATRIAAVGSLSGVAVAVMGIFMIHGAGTVVPWAGLLVALLIVWRHRGNIRRMISGTENKV